MIKSTKYEMETIYNYNQEEPLASCYTMDKALIRRMDALAQKHKEITVIKSSEGLREYTFPKKWIKVKIPRQLSDEKRQELKNRALRNFQSKDGGDNSEQE